MRRGNLIVRFASILSLAISSLAHGGIYMEAVKRDRQTGKEQPLQSMKVQDGMARMESFDRADTGRVVIFREDAFHFVDSNRKAYFVVDRATAAQMSDAIKQMQAQLAKLPPDQRAMLDAMMKQRGASLNEGAEPTPKLDARATGKSETALERRCNVWDVTRNGQLWEQLCVVPISKVPGKDEFQLLMRRMQPLSEQLSGPVKRQFSENPLQLDQKLANKLRGMPFITRVYKNGELTNEEFIVSSWVVREIDPEEFNVPANYTKQSPPQMSAPFIAR